MISTLDFLKYQQLDTRVLEAPSLLLLPVYQLQQKLYYRLAGSSPTGWLAGWWKVWLKHPVPQESPRTTDPITQSLYDVWKNVDDEIRFRSSFNQHIR